MSTKVTGHAHVMPCVFVESFPATEGRSYVQALVRPAGDGPRPLRLIRFLLLARGAAERFRLGDHVELLSIEWLTTVIDQRQPFNWIRVGDIRPRYLDEGC